MAANTGRKSSSAAKKNTRSSSNANRGRKTNQSKGNAAQESAIMHEIALIVIFALAVILFLCNFGIVGPIGNQVRGVLFGLFGLTAYLMPLLAFVAIAFWYINPGNPTAVRKIVAGIVLFLMAGILCEYLDKEFIPDAAYNLAALYKRCSGNRSGGGVFAGSIAYLFCHFLDMVGAILVVIVLSIISLVIVTERSFVNGVKNSGMRMMEKSREEADRRKEYAKIRRQEQETLRREREENRRLRAEEKENEKILRMDKKVEGVMVDTSLMKTKEALDRDDIHEIMFKEEGEDDTSIDFNKITIRSANQMSFSDMEPEYETDIPKEQPQPIVVEEEREAWEEPDSQETIVRKKPAAKSVKPKEQVSDEDNAILAEIHNAERKQPKKYAFPPLSLLHKSSRKGTGDSTKTLKETAIRLQQTLNTFGVKVTITDISQGPAVTRYELQPEQGVKVSKIVGLADDIKLNLAATDIRIEAPIPGKAAIGIEVPNKENVSVALRDLLESGQFKEFPSKLAFAVGKDISGQVVVADIAKMPHMLIAGATGSGKSVCINTLIMSILYKANPDEVKLIMIDPKVVELSVYNGIPHLLTEVVTDPKKAAAALHWGVSEMTERYKQFADLNVRDLKGYNQKVASMQGDDAPKKMPQIVIIVDELADLMMVAPGEVEESICRLAQLARAAGIHLIIATQRPSVDVITGLIKANMPSRVAFSVSSGVDSRTILDMNGAEKLLGKGDMLFYPQGYNKPARIQGAFVSDEEVSDVVDFLKNQTLGNVYDTEISEKIQSITTSSGSGNGGSESGDDRDVYFADAGKFVIDKDKASIGMLQRVFKIGFNRAARIMDQLCDYGVVGEEEGTKPRKVLMSIEEFEQLLEEI